MKIGYITDLHARGETPEGRTDNFNKSIFTKLEEAGQIFSKEKVDVIFCGGDWGDSPDIANSVIHDLIGVLRRWNKPIYGIIGSHDYYGYEIKSLKRTAAGIIYKSGLIELIGSDGMPPAIDLGEIIVCGTPHTFWLDDDPKNYYQPKYSQDKLQIQLTHGTLLDKPAPFDYTLLKDVKTESNIVLGAHYHPGWSKSFLEYNNIIFAHPGALARLANTGNTRIPQVMIIDTNPINIRVIQLSTAISFPFKEKLEKSQEEVPMNVNEIVMKLLTKVETNIKEIDIKNYIPKIIKELGYTMDVTEETFKLLERAQEELKI